MATPETALLADFDFDLTSATPHVPRPPTPDPRRTPTPHPPRRSKPQTIPTDAGPKRLRKKPTAIFVGSEPKGQDPAHKPCQSKAQPFFEFARPSHHTLPSLLPLLPSTPSPRFTSSPSLSSSATTVQSSPTLTPTTPHFVSSYSEPQAGTKSFEAFNTWDYNQGRFGLRRAKRLPHREQGLWEVHAVVHIGEDGRDGSSSSGNWRETGQHQGQSSHKHYEWCMQQQRQAGFLATSLPSEPVTTNIATAKTSSARNKPPLIQNNATPRDSKLESFHGIHSESTRREGALRKTQTGESSNFSLSKYHFPAPPGDYRVGLSGDLQHPTRVHYRGASFDLVNPHASLILSSPYFETPAELDGLLDNYFEDAAAMPRALYGDAESARRDIMRLGDVDEAVPADTGSHETSVASLVPTRVRSDPFDLRVTDVPSQAAQMARSSTAGASTIADIYEGYDYTRETPYEHELTLRALESGSMRQHAEAEFRQFSEEAQQAMDAGLSVLATETPTSDCTTEMPTSDRTYGDTGQLLGLTPKQPNQGFPPITMPYSEAEARRRLAPGGSDAVSLFCDSSDSGSRSSQRARGRIMVDSAYRDFSSNTIQSDGEGDWETTRSESRVDIRSGLSRHSVESYANTSTYDENNRLSAMSDATVAGTQSYRPYRTAHARPLMDAKSNEEDVKRARKALEKIYKDKVLEQDIMANLVGDRTVSKETRHTDRGILKGLRDRRQSAILQAHDNDIELEEIRKKNPQAVRLAADQLYLDNAPGDVMPQRAAIPMNRLQNAFNRRRSTVDQLTNRDIMDKAIGEDDNRNLLAATPTTIGGSSHLAFSESAHTFRTYRDEEYTLSPLEYNSRAALDLGERPYSPAIPAATYSPDESRGGRPNNMPEPRHHARAKAPRKPARRAAMSSQTSLRHLITTGSPTSNIQGAFTDREMAEASRRWDLLPRHHNYYRRTQGRNASGPFPRFHDSLFHPGNTRGRMLMRPSEVMDPQTLLLQERLSKRFLMRILAFPPLCLMYYGGYYDYWITNKSDGKVKAMSPSRKDDALSWAILLSIVYCIIVIGVVVSVAIAKESAASSL